MCSIPPTPSYDILANDFTHDDYSIQFDAGFNFDYSLNGVLAPNDDLVYNPTFDGGPAPNFETYNQFPQYQMQPPFTGTPSSDYSTSQESSSTPPSSILDNIPQLYPELQDDVIQPFGVAQSFNVDHPFGVTQSFSVDHPFGVAQSFSVDQPSNVAQPFDVAQPPDVPQPSDVAQVAQPFAAPPAPSSSKVVVSVRRTRGPNKRPPGTGYANLMQNLPPDVQDALKRTYEGCCESVNQNDNSSWQKHIFSNRHCNRLTEEQQLWLPSYVCPAFIAGHKQCKSAKAGRYDSAERHCQNCSGYKEIKSRNNVFPVQVTKREFKAIQALRVAKIPDQKDAVLAGKALERLVRMMLDGGMVLELGADALGVTTNGDGSSVISSLP